MGTFVDFKDTGLALNISFDSDLFKFQIAGEAVGTKLTAPTDFKLTGYLNNEVEDYLRNRLPELMEDAKEKYDEKSSSALTTLENAKTEVKKLQVQIDALWARDEAAVSAAQRSLNMAQAAVQQAEKHVEELDSTISHLEKEIDDLPWYLKWEAVGLGAAIAATYVAKEAALGVLEAARFTLQEASAATAATPYVDPEIGALVVAKGTAIAALDVAEASVKGVNYILDNILTASANVTPGVIDLFNPEYLYLHSEFTSIKKGDLGHLTVRGWFVGRHVEFDVEVNLSLAEHLAKEIWNWIAECFGDHGQLNYSEYLV